MLGMFGRGEGVLIEKAMVWLMLGSLSMVEW